MVTDKKAYTKRQNINVSPEQEAQIEWLKDTLDVSSAKDAVIRSVQVMSMLVREAKAGNTMYLQSQAGDMKLVVIPELTQFLGWRFLVERKHSWRKQLYVKGRRLLASTI